MTDEKFQKYMEWEGEMLEKYGYYMHTVPDVCKKGFINMHTHGLEAYEGGRNIRAVLDTPYTQTLVQIIASRIMEGFPVLPDEPVSVNGIEYGYLSEDPDQSEELQEEGMLRLVITRNYDTNEGIGTHLIIQQEYSLHNLEKKGE